MVIRYCLTTVLLTACCHQAVSLNLRRSQNRTVCVSLAAFEDQDFVEALIENFLHFAEPATKLALHLDRSSEYNGAENNWASDRVAITTNRIQVRKFSGSVLYAHMLNVDTMEKTWPGTCEYWVMQASNMMWVRSGMEQYVRAYEFSPLGSQAVSGGPCAWKKEIVNSRTFVGFSEKLNARKNLFGRGQPEGSFFPFSVVQRFKVMMDKHLRETHDSGAGIYDAKCYFENVWLQTYALNYEEVPEGPEFEKKREYMTHLCKNRIEYDNIPISEVRAVMTGGKGYGGYFAVKRVDRNVSHDPTKFIINLARQP